MHVRAVDDELIGSITFAKIPSASCNAVDAGFDAQLATTRDFVAIPSTRGAEGPCQDMIGDLLRAARLTRSTTGISTSRI